MPAACRAPRPVDGGSGACSPWLTPAPPRRLPMCRRLLCIRRGLLAMPSSAALPDPASRLPAKAAFHSAVGETLAEFLPLPLDVKGRGVAPDALDRIEQRKRAAIEAEDYRAAAECHDLLTVLQPVTVGSELTLADASPPTLEGQRDFFRQFGFVVLRKVFAGDNLDRLVAAWRRVQRPAGPIWREQLRIQEQEAAEFDKTQRPDETAAEFYRRRSVAGKDRKIGRNFFDIAKDDLFAGLRDELRAGAHDSPPLGATLLDLLDPPRLVALLKALLGNELHMFAIQARTYPASSPASAAGSGFGTDADELRGYIGWHRDFTGPGHGVSINPASVIKVFTFFEDVSEDGGATTVVPGSHRLTFDPRNAFLMVDGFDELVTATTGAADAAAQKAAEHVDPYYHVQPQSAMPNAFKFAVNAGDVCLFDTTIWHTASPNTSGRDRENTIIHYQANSRPATPAVPLDVLGLADSAGLLSHERKKLLAYDPNQ